MRSPARFRQLAVGVLALNLPVILWGAYVRATYSGDGCGQHWPSCNGELIPLGASTKTLIEYTHRVTAGFSVIGALLLAAAAWYVFPRRHPARRATGAVLGFTMTEALLGAGLVLFRFVAHDERAGRVGFMSAHLLNTFALLAAQVRTIQAAQGAPLKLKGHGSLGWLTLAGVASLAILGVSGAITALGDTLYPASSLMEGLRSDLAPTAHLLTRLRVLHPFVALATVALCASTAATAMRDRPSSRAPATILITLFAAQLVVGMLNLAFLAPVSLQLLHLLMADLVWLTYIWLSGEILSSESREVSTFETTVPQTAA